MTVCACACRCVACTLWRTCTCGASRQVRPCSARACSMRLLRVPPHCACALLAACCRCCLGAAACLCHVRSCRFTLLPHPLRPATAGIPLLCAHVAVAKGADSAAVVRDVERFCRQSLGIQHATIQPVPPGGGGALESV